jgi:hypothetical protein
VGLGLGLNFNSPYQKVVGKRLLEKDALTERAETGTEFG